MTDRLTRHQLNMQQARALADAALNQPDATGTRLIGQRTTGYDPQRLRGIPAIGPNCPGHIPGTRPDKNGR